MIDGTFGATGTSREIEIIKEAPIALWGTWVGTVELQYKVGGDFNGVSKSYTANDMEFIEKPGTYRLECTAYTSGTINYQIGQDEKNVA